MYNIFLYITEQQRETSSVLCLSVPHGKTISACQIQQGRLECVSSMEELLDGMWCTWENVARILMVFCLSLPPSSDVLNASLFSLCPQTSSKNEKKKFPKHLLYWCSGRELSIPCNIRYVLFIKHSERWFSTGHQAGEESQLQKSLAQFDHPGHGMSCFLTDRFS